MPVPFLPGKGQDFSTWGAFHEATAKENYWNDTIVTSGVFYSTIKKLLILHEYF